MFFWLRSIPFIAICCFMLLFSISDSHSQNPQKKSADAIKMAGCYLKSHRLNELVKIATYDPQLFELAYQIFVQNGNSKDAYTVASIAVKNEPMNFTWRKRLAESAIWNQKATVALQQYIYMGEQTQDESLLLKAENMARIIHEETILAQLLTRRINKGTNETTVWQEYVNTLVRIGNIKEALTSLESHMADLPPKFYLTNVIYLYRLNAKIQQEQEALAQYQREIAASPDYAITEADLYLSRGDACGAFARLRAVKCSASAKHIKFWEAYANLALLVHQPAEERYAYLQLLQQKKPSVDVFDRLIFLSRLNPRLAYHYAELGRKFYPEESTFTEYLLFNSPKLNRWNAIPELLCTTPPKVLKALRNLKEFWSVMASYWQKTGRHNHALLTYQEGIHHLPRASTLKADYLSFLINTGDVKNLEHALPLWLHEVPESTPLWQPYAIGYARLNNTFISRMVIQFYYDHLEEYQCDPYWLIALKDILEDTAQGRQVTRYAWPIYLCMLAAQTEPIEYSQLINYAKLSLQEAPGDTSAQVLCLLQREPMTEDAEELILAWALQQNNYALAEAIYKYYKMCGFEPPAWIRLSIALYSEDRTELQELLTQYESISSYRDVITAAQKVENIPLAQSIAFKELASHPNDYELYSQFTEVMLKTANHVDVNSEYFQYGPAVGFRERVALTYFISPRISLTAYNSIWFLETIDTTQLATVPPKDERAGIKLEIAERRGKLLFELGFRENLESFVTARVARHYRLYHDLDTVVALGFQEPADDTTSLLVGGMKDYLYLAANYTITPRDSLNAEIYQNFFYTQDRHYVASGRQETMRYYHKLWHTYPEWTLSGYGTSAQYQRKEGLLTGSILQLIPPTVTPDVNFLIPADFYEYGSTIAFGQQYIEEYTHAWRPFGSYTLGMNSVTGLVRLYNFGIAGTLLGRDHLAFFYEEGTNQGGGGVKTMRLARISYSYYF